VRQVPLQCAGGAACTYTFVLLLTSDMKLRGTASSSSIHHIRRTHAMLFASVIVCWSAKRTDCRQNGGSESRPSI
jgi:hypothetical protein